MIYFDNAATGGQKPDAVQAAVVAATKLCANPGRSGHKLSLACATTVQNTRNALHLFFDGYTFDRVVFTKNCTEALNIALLGSLQPGDHAVVSCMEHNSVLRPLEYLRKQGKITYDVCPLDKEGNLDPQTMCSLVKSNTKLVAVTSASNVTGAIPPIKAIREMLPANVLLLCDGAQGAGHFPISMRKMGIDILTIAGHKGMMGIQGSGALLFSERVDLSPLLYGGTGSMSLSLDMPDFYPDALEAGTLSFPAIASLLEGTRFVQHNLTYLAAHAEGMTAYFLKGLQSLPMYIPYSKPNPCGIVAFAHQSLQSEYVAEILSSKFDIAVRGGLHCAPLMHEALSTLSDGLVRVSFSSYNSQAEVNDLLSALQKMTEE